MFQKAENTLFIEKIELTQGKDNTNIITWYLCFGAYVYSSSDNDL